MVRSPSRALRRRNNADRHENNPGATSPASLISLGLSPKKGRARSFRWLSTDPGTRFICTGIVDQDSDPAESLVGLHINCRRPINPWPGRPLKQWAHDGIGAGSIPAEMGWRDGMAAA